MGTISHHHRSAAPELDAGRHTPVSRWRRRSINSLRATIALLAAACFTASDFKSRNVRAPGNTLTGIWNAAPLTTAVCGALTAQDAVAADSQPPDRQPETYCRHWGFGFVNAPQQARRIRTRETVVRVRQKSPWEYDCKNRFRRAPSVSGRSSTAGCVDFARSNRAEKT
jgi:hypothetical protein